MEEVLKRVNQLTATFEPKHIEKVLLQGAKIIAQDAERRVGSMFKVKTGRLKGAMRAKRGKRFSNTIATVFAAVDRSPKKGAPHAQLLERGTSKMPPRPFFRPAVEASQSEVASTVNDGLKELLERGAK